MSREGTPEEVGPPSGTGVDGVGPSETRDAPTPTQEEQRWREAMVAAQAGDGQRYQELLRELVPVIRRQVRGRLRDDALAEDVVQNALLSIHRARHTYRPERPFGPWMRAIARNAAIDAQRERKRRSDREVGLENPDWMPDPRAGEGAEGTRDRGLAPELERALAGLPDKQREAVWLVQIEGLSVAEAAARAGVSVGALKVRAHRGYRALRERLSGESR